MTPIRFAISYGISNKNIAEQLRFILYKALAEITAKNFIYAIESLKS